MTKKTFLRSLPRFYLHFVLKNWGRFFLLFLTIIIWGITTTALPYLVKVIVDRIVSFKGDPQDIYSVVWKPAVLYVICRFSLSVFMRVEDITKAYTLPKVKAQIQEFMFKTILNYRYNFFLKQQSGNIANKVMNIGDSFEKLYDAVHDSLVPCFVSFAISSIFMWQTAPPFVLFFAIWFTLALSVTGCLSLRCVKFSKSRAEAKSTVVGNIVDVFRNITTVFTFSNSKYEVKRLGHYQDDVINKSITLEKELIKIHLFRSFLTASMLCIMIFLLIYGWQRGWVTIGDFSFVSSTAFALAHQVWHAAKQFVVIHKHWGIARQAFDILKPEFIERDLPDAKPIKVKKGEIQFDDVFFSYPDGMEVFRGQNIFIKKQEKVGLVGFSGSGKTTFVKLILRFFTPQRGTISIDGEDITTVTRASLRNQVAFIPQAPGLFNRTVYENILYGNLKASKDDVLSAVEKSHCDEFLCRFELGLDTMLGEQGSAISGGQQQRIAIARAIVRNAPILILDEATSALDSATEKQIQASMEKLMEDKTALVIAHRLSTLRSMDRILVFHDGTIIEEGTHRQLLAQKGHYAMLWSMQTDGFIPDDPTEASSITDV